MPPFENYTEEARRIEREIERHGVLLGIDWQDEGAVRALAREALAYRPGGPRTDHRPVTPQQRTKVELFGLAQLMLKVMTESAGENIRTHGGPAWKAFARALWNESGLG
jgi:hypothetical protein